MLAHGLLTQPAIESMVPTATEYASLSLHGIAKTFTSQSRTDIPALSRQGPGLERVLVFQEHRLMPWIPIEENVAFGLRALAPDARRRTVAEHIELVGLRFCSGSAGRVVDPS